MGTSSPPSGAPSGGNSVIADPVLAVEKRSTSRLGRLLVELDYVSEGQLAEAEAVAARRSSYLSKELVELGFISEPKLMLTLVKECKVPHLRLTDYAIAESVIELIPENICLRHGLLPIDLLGSILTVAMVNPLDADALDVLRRACPSVQFEPILCSWTDFDRAARKLFPDNPFFTHAEFAFTQAHLPGARDGGFGGRTQFGEISVAPTDDFPDALMDDAFVSPELDAFFDVIQGHVHQTMRGVLANVSDVVARVVGRSQLPSDLTREALAAVVRDAMLESIEDGMESLSHALGRALAENRSTAAKLTTQQLDEHLRSSFRNAIEDASPVLVEALALQLRRR